jgi:disulfide bond formation protein DsbB
LQASSVALVGYALWTSTATTLEYRQRRWLVLATLLSPVAFLATRFEVYEPILGFGALAMTLSAGHQGLKASRSWWWPAIAASCRIEMAVTTVVAGLLLIRRRESRRLGLLSCGLGAAGALVSLWLAILAGPDAASFGAHFSHLGGSVGEAAAAIVERPFDALRPVGEPAMIASLALSLLPWGLFPPLAGWRYLLLALPLAGVAIVGVWEPADIYFHHYWYGFLVGGSFATAEFLRTRSHLFSLTRRLSLVGLAGAWLAMIPLWPLVTPFGHPETPQLRMIKEFAESNGLLSLSVPAPVLGHLIDRPTVYFFPRPVSCLEEAIGQFRWIGSPPELVIVTDSQAAFVEISPWGEVLAARYQKVASPPGTHAWTLTEARLFSNECVR